VKINPKILEKHENIVYNCEYNSQTKIFPDLSSFNDPFNARRSLS